MLRRPAEQAVSKQEGDTQASPGLSPDLLPVAAPVPGGWRAFGREEIARLHRLYYDPRVAVKNIARVYRVSTSTLLRWIDEMDWPTRRGLKRSAVEDRRAFGRELLAQAQGQAEFGLLQQDRDQTAAAHAERRRIAEGLETLTPPATPSATPSATPVAQPLAPPPAPAGLSDPPAAPAASPAPPPLAQEDKPVDPLVLSYEIERAVRQEIAVISASIHDPSPQARERNARALSSLVRTLQAVTDWREAAPRRRARYDPRERDEREPEVDMEALKMELAATLERIKGGPLHEP